MAGLERRLEKLEYKIASNPHAGKHSLKISINDGEQCDVVLQCELDEKSITLDEVSYLLIVCNTRARPMRDFQNHPEWELLQEFYESNRTWTVLIVKDKEEWEEYQQAMQEEQREPSLPHLQ